MAEKRRFKIPKIPIKLNLTTILVALVVLIIVGELGLGTGGCIEVEPGEVAVSYDNTGFGLFGEVQSTNTEQGVKMFIPGLQTIHVLERRPQVFVMSNEEVRKSRKKNVSNVASSLTVRAKDGSNFYFDRLETHYQITPASAADVITTSGPGDSYQSNLVGTHSREILRDEFGRYDFIEIANPATYGTATAEAKKLLNERLVPYGVEVTQIVTPKPKFEERVEKAIEDRQNAEQEVDVQEEKRRKLDLEKGLKIQSIEQAKNAEYQALLAELESKKKASSNSLISTKREADKYFIERAASGNAYRDEKVVRAKANAVAYRKAAEGMVAKITAVGAAGPDVLNRVIAEEIFPQLKNISGTPLIKPSSPLDVRYLTPKGGK